MSTTQTLTNLRLLIALLTLANLTTQCVGQVVQTLVPTSHAKSSDKTTIVAPQEIWAKSADLRRLGIIDLNVSGSYALPPILQANSGASCGLELRVSHKLKNQYTIEPLLLRVEGTTNDLKSIHAGENILGQIKFDFSGLLLNGLPRYLEAKAGDYFRKHQITFDRDESSTSHGTLTRVIRVNIEQHQLDQLNRDLGELTDLEAAIAQSLDRTSSEFVGNELANKRKRYIELKARQSEILKNISNTDLACLPSITKRIRFPIWEKGTNESAGGKQSSVSASAKAGVSGDVLISITPRCHISIGSNATLDTALQADVVIQSHGFFGVRADAVATTALHYEFQSPVLGIDHQTSELIGEKEREILKQLISDSLISTQDVAEVNRELVKAVKNSQILADANAAILEDLIGTRQAPASVEKLCRLFEKAGGLPGSSADLICRYAKTLPPTQPILVLPAFVEPALPPMPVKPLIACVPQLPRPECRFEAVPIPQPPHPCMVSQKVVIPYLCPTLSNPGKICHRTVTKQVPGVCPTPPIIIHQWVPAGCNLVVAQVDEANRLARLHCDELAAWERQLSTWQQDVLNIQTEARRLYNERVAQLRAAFEAKQSQFATELANFNRYTSKEFIYDTALEFARTNILLQSFSDELAQQIVNEAWSLNEEVNNGINCASKLVQPMYSGFLTLDAKVTARLAFNSTAHLVEITPRIEETASYRFNTETRKHELAGTFRFVPHSNADDSPRKTPRIGGLDVLGMVIEIDSTIGIANRKRTFQYNQQVFNSNTVGDSVDLGYEPIQKSFTLDFAAQRPGN